MGRADPLFTLGIEVHSHLLFGVKFPGGLVVKNPPAYAGRCGEFKFDPSWKQPRCT